MSQEAAASYATAILTVSDTASKDSSADQSGPLIKRQLKYAPQGLCKVVEQAVVPDDPKVIQKTVREWIDERGVRLVVTTGGTGLGTRDCTPEALLPLITKNTPGLSQALTAHGLSKTPLAALSRLVSGIRQVPDSSAATSSSSPSDLHGSPGALIVALPGSAKAVKECLEVLQGTDDRPGVLLHALQLCAAGPGSTAGVQQVHTELQGEQGRRSASVADENHQNNHTEQQDQQQSGWDNSKQNNHAEQHQHHPGHSHGDHQHNHTAQPQQEHDHGHSHSPQHHHHGGHSQPHDHTPQVHAHAAPKPRTAAGSTSSYVTHSPHGPSTHRSRQSPYPILSLAEALALIDEHTPKAVQSEKLPVNEDLVGCVLAQDVKASQDLPMGNTTNVDGYAVAVNATPPGDYTVVTASELAKRQPDDDGIAILPGEVCRVNTGQALPQGTNGVVMVEDTELLSTSTDDAGIEQESRIKVLAQIDPNENVRKRGSDVRAGQVVLSAGTPISALGGEIGTLVFLGVKKVAVYKRPKVAVLSTGDELRELQDASTAERQSGAWGFSVYDSNRPGLKAAIRGQGLDIVDLGILGDDTDRLIEILKKGLEESDIILTTGGTSMGESDLLKPIIERELQGQVHFGRVSMKPGKPTTFATIASPKGGPPKIIFALPGNPASALVTFYVFVLPSLRKMMGHRVSPAVAAAIDKNNPATANPFSLPRIKVQLASAMRLDNARPEFHRVVVTVNDQGQLMATSTGSQRSSGMHSMSTANALVCLPTADGGGKRQLDQGEVCDAILLGSLWR